jgi:hypothetical protein
MCFFQFSWALSRSIRQLWHPSVQDLAALQGKRRKVPLPKMTEGQTTGRLDVDVKAVMGMLAASAHVNYGEVYHADARDT